MKTVLVAYFSESGTTEKMAGFIAEGLRFSGHQAVVKKMEDIKTGEDLKGYDGYIFGAPTYNQDVPGPVETFMDLAGEAELAGKPAGSFSSYRHDVGYTQGGQSADILLDTMQNQYGMNRFELGPLRLKDQLFETMEGMRACQDYGKVFGEKLA